MKTEVRVNQPYYLEIYITDKLGNFASGLTVIYNIYKSSDNSLVASGTLTEYSNIYRASTSFSEPGQYRIEYITPSKFENAIETIVVTDVYDKITRILGLTQENYRLMNPIYDSKGNLIEGVIKIYNNPSDLENDQNPIASYKVTAVHDSSGNVTDYKVVKQ